MPSTAAVSLSDPVANEDQGTRGLRAWLERPLSGLSCALSWSVATAVYLGTVALLGGPTANDATESVYSTWAVSHGDLSCAYPPVTTTAFLPNYRPGPHVPPLWPLISGGIAWATRIGHAAPFPSSHSLGANCGTAYAAMYQWAGRSLSLVPTIGVGYLSWFVLLGGVIAVLRASGRGRSGWEAVGVTLVALVPIVWQPLLLEYHPQDLLAVGLALGGLACVERRDWVWGGVLLGLAVASQQFALLVLAPLVVVVSTKARWRLLTASVAAWLFVTLPFLVSSRGTWSAVAIGTGNFASYGGTVLWELRLHGAPLVFFSRFFPIVVSMAMAWWVARRLGSRILEPVLLISLLATSVSLRLVFEQNLYGYYFVALAVMLVLLDVVCGRLRGELVAWLALVSIAFNPVPFGLAFNARSWGHPVASALPLVGIGIVLALVTWDAVHRRVRWYLLVWLALVAFASLHWPPWVALSLRHPPSIWLQQIVLLSAGVYLAVVPLVTALRSERSRTSSGTELAVPTAA